MSPPATILIVDDQPVGRQVVRELLMSPDYALLFAANGPEALGLLEEHTPDLVLLDVMMPGMDGFEVCRRIRADARLADIAVVMLTTLDDRQSKLAGIDAGADDFITRPFDRSELRARVRTITRLNRFRRLHNERHKFERLIELSPDGVLMLDADGTIQLDNQAFRRMLRTAEAEPLVGWQLIDLIAEPHRAAWSACFEALVAHAHSSAKLELGLLTVDRTPIPVEITASSFMLDGLPTVQVLARDISERKLAEAQITELHSQLIAAYDATLEGWSQALDLRDKETEGHSKRVTDMTLQIAQAYGLSDEDLVHLRRGALLHDVGKLGVPDRILLKPGPLDAEEWSIMKLHPVYAYQWLKSIAYLERSLDIPYCHHERWDGKGYPQGLAGEHIPLAARIFAVADTWDAICSDRPYRKGRSAAEARAIIAEASGTQFDPAVVRVFLGLTGS